MFIIAFSKYKASLVSRSSLLLVVNVYGVTLMPLISKSSKIGEPTPVLSKYTCPLLYLCQNVSILAFCIFQSNWLNLSISTTSNVCISIAVKTVKSVVLAKSTPITYLLSLLYVLRSSLTALCMFRNTLVAPARYFT